MANKSKSPDSDTQLSLRVAREIARDASAPAAARIQAVRTLLELNGKIGRHAKPADGAGGKTLAELSRAELLEELERLRTDPFGDGS